jgi:hypothetical protein
MTDFFEPFVKYGPQEAEKRELAQAKNLSEAAAETSGLSHYIWSTLPSSAILSKGKYHTPHFESKASVDEYILKQFPELTKTTFLWIAYYANNLTFPPFTPNLLKTSGKYGWYSPLGHLLQLIPSETSARTSEFLSRQSLDSQRLLAEGMFLQRWKHLPTANCSSAGERSPATQRFTSQVH